MGSWQDASRRTRLAGRATGVRNFVEQTEHAIGRAAPGLVEMHPLQRRQPVVLNPQAIKCAGTDQGKQRVGLLPAQDQCGVCIRCPATVPAEGAVGGVVRLWSESYRVGRNVEIDVPIGCHRSGTEPPPDAQPHGPYQINVLYDASIRVVTEARVEDHTVDEGGTARLRVTIGISCTSHRNHMASVAFRSILDIPRMNQPPVGIILGPRGRVFAGKAMRHEQRGIPCPY